MRRSTKQKAVICIGLLVVLAKLWALGSRAQAPQDAAFAFTRITDGPIASDGGTIGAAWADVDHDGYLDLFTVGTFPRGFVRGLYHNKGKGIFTKITDSELVTTGGTALGVSWGDVDNDGDLDIAAGGIPSALYLNDGSGRFRRVESGDVADPNVRGWSPSWVDYDNDGDLDLFITHPAGFAGTVTRNHLFRNTGPPEYTLIRVTESAVSSETAPFTTGSWSDYDQDGDQDLFIASGPANGTKERDFYYKNLLKETGVAVFERIEGVPFADEKRDGQTVNWIDVDNDQELDFFVTNFGGMRVRGFTNDLYRNQDGQLVKDTEDSLTKDRSISLANVWGDLDNDGYLDVIVVNDGRNGFYHNNGDGTFTRITQGTIATDSNTNWGASLGDFDHDGDLDVFIPALRTNSRHFLYRNDLANGNGWIELELVGTSSNRSGIGAKVRVRATIDGRSVWQLREVSSQNSFLGHNMLRVHFGLGDARQIDELVIEWPSGVVDRFTEVEPKQLLIAQEGVGLAPLN